VTPSTSPLSPAEVQPAVSSPWDLAPPTARSHPSVVAQLDAILHVVFRLRIEWDLLAISPASSHCASFGEAHYPWSSSCVLFDGQPGSLPRALVDAEAHGARILFILPSSVFPRLGFEEPLLQVEIFDSPSTTAFLLNFGAPLTRRSKRAPEFVAPLDLPRFEDGAKIGATPFSLPLLLAPPSKQALAGHALTADPVPPAQLYKSSKVLEDPPPPPRVWDAAKFGDALGHDYPSTEARDFVLKGLDQGFGEGELATDTSVPLISRNMPSYVGFEDIILDSCIKEVSAGRMLGPFAESPFPNNWCEAQPHTLALGQVPKSKHDPHSGEKRVISHGSKPRPWDLNTVSYDPFLFLAYFTFGFLLTEIALLGKNTVLVAFDVKKAYRTLPLHVSVLFHFLRRLPLPDRTVLWFVDLVSVFGAKMAWRSWEMVGGLISFVLELQGFKNFRFVDNYFVLVPPLDGEADLQRASGVLESCKRVVGDLTVSGDPDAVLHDFQAGTSTEELGWRVDTAKMEFSETPKRRLAVSALLDPLASKAASPADFYIDSATLDSLVGVMIFLSVAFSVARPGIADLIRLRKTQSNFTVARRKTKRFRVGKRVRHVLMLWKSEYSLWNGTAPIFPRFGPATPFFSRLRTDGATTGGGGAVLVLGGAEPVPTFLALIVEWTPASIEAARRKKALSAPYLELLAVYASLLFFAARLRGSAVLLEGDCKPAIQALNGGYSPEPHLAPLLDKIYSLLIRNHISTRFVHISRDFNMTADRLSMNSQEEAVQWAAKEFPRFRAFTSVGTSTA
jgi:hypothetical protein